MNCLKCSEEFNFQVNVPRLLPQCGHTLCSPCVKMLINSNFIVCPECKQINIAGSENDLPKNLAILSLQLESKKGNKRDMVFVEGKVCRQHHKELENFCLDCCEYGCIQCLGSHVKQHRIKGIDELEYFLCSQIQQFGKDAKELKLPYRLQKIQIEKSELLSSINSYKTEIHTLFSELKTLCEKKEEDVLNFLKSLYDVQLVRLMEEEKETKNAVERLNAMQATGANRESKQLIQYYTHNMDIFNGNYYKSLNHDKSRQLKPNQLSKWEAHYNKFKQTMSKQIKAILNVKSVPVSSTINVKSIAKTSRDQARFYQTKTHIRLKQTKSGQAQNISPIMRQSKPDVGVSNHTSTKECRSILTYGGYTDEKDDSKVSGLQIYGNKKVFQKYVGCVGHVKFGILQHNKQVLIFGGKVDNKRIDYIFTLSSLKEGFKISGRLQRGKSGFGYCKVDRSFFVVGGHDGEISSSCQEYDLDTLEFKRSLPFLDIERDELTLTSHGRNMYAIGGYNGRSDISLKSVDIFSQQKWSPGADLVKQRRSHSSISLNTGLFVVGGYSGANHLSSVERLNQQTGQWEELFELIHPRCTFGIAAHEQGFIVLGGFAKTPTDSCEICSTKTLKARQGDPMGCKRFMHSCINLEGFRS